MTGIQGKKGKGGTPGVVWSGSRLLGYWRNLRKEVENALFSSLWLLVGNKKHVILNLPVDGGIAPD